MPIMILRYFLCVGNRVNRATLVVGEQKTCPDKNVILWSLELDATVLQKEKKMWFQGTHASLLSFISFLPSNYCLIGNLFPFR